MSARGAQDSCESRDVVDACLAGIHLADRHMLVRGAMKHNVDVRHDPAHQFVVGRVAEDAAHAGRDVQQAFLAAREAVDVSAFCDKLGAQSSPDRAASARDEHRAAIVGEHYSVRA